MTPWPAEPDAIVRSNRDTIQRLAKLPVVGLPFVAVDVAGEPLAVDWVVLDDLLCLCVAVVVDELLLDPPHAASATASITTAADTMTTRARAPEHGVRCMS